MASPLSYALFNHVTAEGGCPECSAALIMYGIFCIDCIPASEDRMQAVACLCDEGARAFIESKIDVTVAKGIISPFSADSTKKHILEERAAFKAAEKEKEKEKADASTILG
jgi:hypothetical protein